MGEDGDVQGEGAAGERLGHWSGRRAVLGGSVFVVWRRLQGYLGIGHDLFALMGCSAMGKAEDFPCGGFGRRGKAERVVGLRNKMALGWKGTGGVKPCGDL